MIINIMSFMWLVLALILLTINLFTDNALDMAFWATLTIASIWQAADRVVNELK